MSETESARVIEPASSMMQGITSINGAAVRAGIPGSNTVIFPAKMELAPRPIDPDDPAWVAVEASIMAAVDHFNRCEPEARRAEVVGIHQLRTATRRLRSQLRTLGILVDSAWKQETEIELKWLASVLGSVRDLDVLEERLNERLDETETSIPAREALTPIFERLATRRIQAIQHLKVALASERYLALKHRLERAMIERPWIERATPTCREALGPLAASAWRKLKKHAHKLGLADHEEAFHDVRKLAKRARYTSELVAPLIGRAQSTSARGFVRVTTRVQKKLGEHHDSAMLIAELQSHTREHEGSVAFSIAAQTLIDAEKARSRRARKAFFQEWDKLDRKKWRAWMKPKTRVKV